MSRLPSFRRLLQWGPRFAESERGNVAILFGLTLVPLVCFMGSAIDYGRAARARSAMQSAIDATALMLSKDLSAGTINSADVSAKAQTYFNGLYTDAEAQGVTINVNYQPATATSQAKVVINGNGYVQSDFMQIAGFPTLAFNAATSTIWGNAKMRVALVLDNTGSMASANKLTTLKSVTAGTNGLIDQLSGLAKNPGDVLISLVPFARVVNVGGAIDPSAIVPTGRTEEPTGITMPSNWTSVGPGSPCPWNNPSTTICINENTGLQINTIASSGKICPKDKNQTGTALYNGCWDSQGTSGHYTHNWNAFPLTCVADRDPYKTSSDTVAKPNPSDPNTLFPAFTNVEYAYPNITSNTAYCPPDGSTNMQPVKPLGSDWTGLKAAVNNMSAAGNTDQGIGLQVGAQTLIPGGAFSAPAESDADITTYQRAIILLSDGWNTEDRWPSDSTAQIDAHQAALCNSIKAATDAKGQPMYTVYTIQVDTDHEGVSNVLKSCASSPAQAYYLTSASGMVDAFREIGASLSKLRVAS